VTVHVVGVLGYFLAQLNDLISYADLQPKVFQYFREIGNAIIFAWHLEKALVQYLCLQYCVSASNIIRIVACNMELH